MLQPRQDGNQELQDFSLRAVCHGFLVQQDRLDFVDQADTLGKLAPNHQHRMMGQRFRVILIHGNARRRVAMSLPDQGSIVKVQFFSKYCYLLSDCTKVTLNKIFRKSSN